MKFFLLLSYAIHQSPEKICAILRELTANGLQVELIIDSGAFTVWNRDKAPIKIENYCAFLKRLLAMCPRNVKVEYITLDVVGDTEMTKCNLTYIQKQGLHPIPVFTYDGKFSDWVQMCKQYDRIALGGVMLEHRNRDAYVAHLLQHSGKCKVHLLGYGNHDILQVCQPYSFDVSNFSRVRRYGLLDIFYLGRMSLHRVESIRKARGCCYRYEAITGIPLADLYNPESWKGSNPPAQTWNRVSHLMYQKFLFEHGVRYYWAMFSLNEIREIIPLIKGVYHGDSGRQSIPLRDGFEQNPKGFSRNIRLYR
jgi:hypothetical protein